MGLDLFCCHNNLGGAIQVNQANFISYWLLAQARLYGDLLGQEILRRALNIPKEWKNTEKNDIIMIVSKERARDESEVVWSVIERTP